MYKNFCNCSMFKFQCPHCGVITFIDYPMLYNDMDKKAMVHYVPSEEVKSTKNMITGQKRVQPWMKDCDFRIVTDKRTLIEKAQILHCNLDDRLVELTKIYYKLRYLKDLSELKDEKLFFVEVDEECIFVPLEGKGKYFDFPKDIYDELNHKYGNILATIKDCYLIDSAWAYHFLCLFR